MVKSNKLTNNEAFYGINEKQMLSQIVNEIIHLLFSNINSIIIEMERLL
jgi:hypothetical protein